MLTKSEIENKLQDIKPELAVKFHVSSIGYFGSYAAGLQTEKVTQTYWQNFHNLQVGNFYIRKIFRTNFRFTSRPRDTKFLERTNQRINFKTSTLHLKPSERDPLLYIFDIQLSMKRVQEYIMGLNFNQFKNDHKTVDAVIRNFEIIGEATKTFQKK